MAFPLASEVRTLPAAGVHPTICIVPPITALPVTRDVPVTSSVYQGFVFQIPIFDPL